MVISFKSVLTQVWFPHLQLTIFHCNQGAIISTSPANKLFSNSWYTNTCLKNLLFPLLIAIEHFSPKTINIIDRKYYLKDENSEVF